MVVIDVNGDVVENPDPSLGKIEGRSMAVTHEYVVDAEETGHWETVAEYPNGGKDVAWVVDSEEAGHWETRSEDGGVVEHFDGLTHDDWPRDRPIPDVWEHLLYTPYTDEDIAAMEEAERDAARAKAVREQTALFVAMAVCAANLPDEQALQVEALYPDWSAEGSYEADDIRRYADELWRCRQAHQAQPSWTPDQAHSLWGRIVAPGEVEEWRQPQPGVFDGYEKGQKVKHNNKTWESTFDGLNVWEPGAVGTESLWKEVV